MGGSTAVWWSGDGQLVVSNRGVWWVDPRPCGGQVMVSWWAVTEGFGGWIHGRVVVS